MLNRRVLFLMVLLGVTAAARANLLPNPGFEAPPAANGLPGESWWLYEARGRPDVRVDVAGSHSGKASVRLQGEEGPKFTLVSPRCEVSPGDELKFEAWMRGGAGTARTNAGYVGLAFRDAAGRVFERAYTVPGALDAQWRLVAGGATAPTGAASAELHVGYTNACGPVWCDDASVEITSPISLAVLASPKPWPGRQELPVRVINRQKQEFVGELALRLGKKIETLAVRLAGQTSRNFNLPLNVPGPGTFSYQLQLRTPDGNTLRRSEEKFRTPPLLTLFPANPCFLRAGQDAGEIQVDAQLAVNPAEREGLQFVVRVADDAGQVRDTGQGTATNRGGLSAKLHVPATTAGKFRVSVAVQARNGRQLASETTEVQVVEGEGARVTIGPDGFLHVAGRAHFPIGMYSCGQYEAMGKAGFSGTHNYGITTGEAEELINPNEPQVKELLDRSWANGMRMMVELPRKAIEKAQWAQIRRRIETFRHHPGLLCWGSEERVARGEAPLANIRALHKLVRDLDPDHPFVLGDTRDVIGRLQTDRRNFFPDECMDVGIWWWYPIPLHAPDANGLEGRESDAGLLQPPSWLTTTLSKKPLWIAIQSYQQPRRDARFPTPEEYRCMAYLSIINGVKGLWFYTGSGQRDWQGKPAGLLNKPQEGHWDYVQQLVRELREMEPVITARPAAIPVERQPADAPVEFAVREVNGEIHLLTANKSPRTQAVKFKSAALAGRKCEVRFEQRTAKLEGDTLTDEFAPFGVRVYHIR